MTVIIPQKMVRYIAADGSLTQEGILLLLSFQEQIEANMSGFEVLQAERAVLQEYGVKVSVAQKRKNLDKFGRNLAVGTSFETVAEFQGTTANETFVTTNTVFSISSSSASDTMDVTVEGHTIDLTGRLTFATQTVTLTGQTPVTLGTPLARANRIFINSSGTFGTTPPGAVGTVYVYDITGGQTGGVPTIPAATKLILGIGDTQGNKCATAFDNSTYWFISTLSVGIGNSGGSANRVTFQMQRRFIPSGGPWRPLGREVVVPIGQLASQLKFTPYIIVPRNNDFRVVAKTNSNTAEVFANASGYLASVIG